MMDKKIKLLLICGFVSSAFFMIQLLNTWSDNSSVGLKKKQEASVMRAQIPQPLNNRETKVPPSEDSKLELRKLSLQLKNLTAQVNDLKSIQQVAENDDNLKIDRLTELDEQEHQIQEFKENLEVHFLSESHDLSWASVTEAKLENAFEKYSESEHQLMTIECRSMTCKLQILHHNGENDLMILQNILAQEARENQVFYSTTDDAGELTTEVFFSREGYSLPSSMDPKS